MWDLSHCDAQGLKNCASNNSQEVEKSLSAYENDTLMVHHRIKQQMDKAIEEYKISRSGDSADAKKLMQIVISLSARERHARLYLKRIQRLRKTQQMIHECKKLAIDPSDKIIAGGGTLKKAAEELDTFFKEPNPFQEFDKGYKVL